MIDSGVNWDHPSFEDPGQGVLPGWDHENPYGRQLGLCSRSDVLCNDKLVGVYDFVEDDPSTPENEENTNGKDNSGHGSHVASIAAGNPLTMILNDFPTDIAGVAPNANIVSYRVCYMGDVVDQDDDGCQTSAIFSAIEQAIERPGGCGQLFNWFRRRDDPWCTPWSPCISQPEGCRYFCCDIRRKLLGRIRILSDHRPMHPGLPRLEMPPMTGCLQR